jgi:hypothetical protein
MALRLLAKKRAARAVSLGGEITWISALFWWTPTTPPEEEETLVFDLTFVKEKNMRGRGVEPTPLGVPSWAYLVGC